MSTENSLSIVRAFEQTIAEGEYAGRTFRYTNDVPRKSSVIDWIVLITGKNSHDSAKYFRDIVKKDKTVEKKYSLLQFPGERQRATPVATASNMLHIIGKLPSKYIESFERERNNLLTRYLGGDTSLCAEVQDLRAAQSNMAANDPDNPLRLFGEAVESGQTGRYVDDRSEARAKSIEGYHGQVDAMRSNPVLRRAGPSYIHTNAEISRAALGMYPRDLRKQIKVGSHVSSRNYMDTNQLNAVALLTGLTQDISRGVQTSQEHDSRVSNMAAEFYDILGRYGVHGYKKVESLPRPLLLTDEKSA